MKNPNRRAAERRAANNKGGDVDTLIVYSSSNGSTMKYASWLAEALDADIVPYSRKHIAYTSLYRNVIFIGWIRAGEITRLSILKQNYGQFGLVSKNVIIVGVGIGPDTETYRDFIADRNGITEDSFFLLPGCYDPKKIKKVDAGSLSAMRGSMCSGMNKADAEVIISRLGENGYDGVNKESLLPVIEAVLEAKKA